MVDNYTANLYNSFMAKIIKVQKGTKDILPQEIEQWHKLEKYLPVTDIKKLELQFLKQQNFLLEELEIQQTS